MSSTEKYWKEFDMFLPELMREDSVEIKIVVEAQNNPGFIININSQTVSDQILKDGETAILVDHKHNSQDQEVSIDFSMYGKTKHDTKVDSDGNIISDKYIIIKDLFINKFSLISDPDFFYGEHLNYHGLDGSNKPIAAGFWFNDTLNISYQRPFSLWYNQRTNRNKSHLHSESAKHDGPLVDELWHNVIKNIKKLEDH